MKQSIARHIIASHTCFSRRNTPYLLEKHSVSLGETLRSSVYLSCKQILLTLLLLISGVVGSWADGYEGIYYIGVYGSGTKSQCASENPAENFYLCPTEGWCYYNGETNNIGQITNGDNGQPFLTSFKCRNGVYDATKAVWTIEKAPDPNSSYYYIKQTCTGKYLVFNKQLNGPNANRVRVHLETITPPATPDEYALFTIYEGTTIDDSYYAFQPKKAASGFYLNISDGNVNSVSTPGNGKTDGPTDYENAYINVSGIVGQWNQKNNTSSFKLERYSPFITFNSSNKVEIKAAPSNATLVYTTDESDPTASPLHGTVVNTNTVSFAPGDDVTTIKAIAIVNGVASAVATFTPSALLGSDHKRLIQSQNNAWNTTDFHFYMIPGDDVGEDPNKITKVNTTSLFRPTMEWHLLYAGKDDLAGDYLNQYYYIVNSNGKYLCYDETNKVYMDTNSDDSDKFKFQIVESATAGTYNIIPFGVTTGNMYLYKQGSNTGADALILFNKPNDPNSRWKFVKKDALDETAPFTATENNSITYYKLQNKATAYYVIPPSWTGGAVTVSNATEADVVNSRNWYFEVAQPSSDTDWLTWYYIRNAVTGDYLYYSGPNPSNDAAAFITKASLNPTDENDMKRYRFTWARSATENYYFIVPQLLKDESQNTISGLNRYSTTLLRIQKNRKDDAQLWQFDDPDYTVAPPNIVYNADVNTVSLSCTTPGATIYYTTNNTEATTSATNSGSSTITIDLKGEGKENVTIIRAIAEASGTSSSETTNNFIVQATVGNVKRPYLIRNNQSSWTVGSEPMFVYYMIPSDVDNGNTTVNTTSMPRPTMEWYFEYAGKVDGKQYYYIVNAFTGDYLYRTGTAIYMKTPSDKTTLEAASDNGFKFYMIPRAAAGTNHAGYSIVPYGETTTNFVSKASGNNNAAAVKLEGTDNDYKRWNFVTKTDLMNDLAAKLPFTPSSGSSSIYYKIQNGKMDSDNKPYYIIPPASIPGNAEASKSEDAAVVKSGSWYFVKVQDPVLENSDPSQIDWLTYYKIVNAETGKVLYYNFTASTSPCIKVGDYVENDGNYMFAFVKSPTTDYYYIVPKTAKDNQLANISCFWRDGANMKPATTRATGNNVWTFAAASLFCNNPEFVEEEGVIKIKCNTNSAKIYINTESNADPTIAEENLYAPTTKENQNWATTSQVRIKAIASVSDGTNSASSAVATLLNKPDFTLTEGGNAVADNTYTYDGTAKQPDVTEVSIGEDANKTTATKTTHFTMSYSNNIKAGTPISENPPTVTLVDVPGDDMYVWNASKTFTINKKPVTITADSDTKVYDGTELTKNTYTNTDLADGDAITSVTVAGSQTVVGSSANVPSAAVIKKGEEDRTACYEITYTNGTLEVTKKAVTITADSDTKVYDGTELTKNSYTNTDLADGDAITSVTVTGSQTVVGSSANVPSAAVIKKGEEDRTACYEITYTNGTLEVTKKAVTITADSDTKVYDGTALTKNSYTNTALAEGDAIESVTVTGSQTDVGSSANVPSAAVIKKDTEDRTSCYEITYTNGTLTVTGIGVIVTADNKTKEYSKDPTTDPTLTATVTGLVGTDVITYTISRAAGEDVNDYAITPSGESKQGNYTVTYVPGTFTITPATLTITPNDGQTKEYGDADPAFTFTPTGLKGTDAIADVVQGTLTRAEGENRGTYAFNQGTLAIATGNNNYTLAYANPNNYVFTISQKPLTSTDITINIDESTNPITVVVMHAKSDGDYILSQKESETDPEYDYSLATVGEGDPGYNPNYFKTRITGNGNYSGYVDIRQAIVHFTTDANQAEWSATFVAEKAGTTDIGHVLPEGIAAYIISGIEGSWAIPEPMDYIPAGVPVLLVAHEEKTGFLVRDAKSENVTDISEEQIGYNKLKEVTEATPDYVTDTESENYQKAPFSTRQIYVLYKNEFVLNKAGYLAKGKVYMENPNYDAPSPSSPAPASLSIAWGNVTGIEDGRWKMDDGRSDRWYTLDGRCLIGKPTAKGLYIVNGKKRVVK